ncbi:THOC7 domain-containing protein [Ceratobasidium sp. AG-Ba]|nr:THOC7 domain-containing protein [Ceratobasidium sp. AG-Ba]
MSTEDSPLPLPTPEQEEALIHARVQNDDRIVRKLTKKLQSYLALHFAYISYQNESDPSLATLVNLTEVDNARDEFLVELASFRLSIQKSTLVLGAEARQVQQYNNEIESIAQEHDATRLDLDNLRLTLEQEQMFRKRKQEYDVVAEKINDFPTRAELTADITALDDELSTIRAAREDHNENLAARRAILDTLVSQIQSLRLMGKQPDNPEVAPSAAIESGSGHALNPTARPFIPLRSAANTPTPGPSTPLPLPPVTNKEGDDDIEMGEVAEEAEAGEVEDVEKWGKQSRSKSRKPDEEMEEGEASDGSTGLSES